ncbi:LacI family DNA-binding transcriptional regulator [Flindersiella endophytica]
MLADVAARVGVSASLVSRVLRGDDRIHVRAETRERILAAAKEIGYVPHVQARNLQASRAGAIGLVVHDVGNPIYAPIIRGVQEVVSTHESVLMLVDATAVTDEAALLQLAASGRVDGLLWQAAGQPELSTQVRVAARHVPVVLVNSRSLADLCSSSPRGLRPHGPTPLLPGVRLDEEAAMAVAIHHLHELGHTRIGFVSGVVGSDVSERRRAAYRTTLRTLGGGPRRAWEATGGWDPGSGQQAMASLLRAAPELTAVVVTNALVATGAVNAIAAAGRRCPQDLSVVAIHDLWFAERLTPPLTVVRLPLREMGRRAAGLLLSGGDESPADTLITEPAPELVLRGSTGAA